MSILTLYHGSKKIISVPDIELSEDFKDFGKGFYLTKSEDAAAQWACCRGKSGFVNKYELETENLNIIDLYSDKYNILNWLALVMANRKYRIPDASFGKCAAYLRANFMPDVQKADIIIGSRADEAYFFIARSFIKGKISLGHLKTLMDAGDFARQLVLKSDEAFRRLSFVSFKGADATYAYPGRKIRNDRVLGQYYEMSAVSAEESEGLYMRDILSGEIKNDDERLW